MPHFYSANVSLIFESFGYGRTIQVLSKSINRLSNALTLPHVARFEFDTMGLWLEATETPRRYRIILILGGSATDKIRAHLNITHFVEFRTDDDVTEDRLPRADYISIRAYACKVAHMASVSRYFDDVKALVEMVAIAPFLPSSMLYIYASSNSQTLKTTYA